MEIRDGAQTVIRRQAIRLAGLDDKAELLRTVAGDQDVRKAVGRTVQRAGQLRRDVDTSDARGELGRLVRDEKLQNQVAGLLRAVTGVLDASVAAGKRKARRRIGLFALGTSAAGAVAFVVVRRLRSSDDPTGWVRQPAHTSRETTMSTGDKLDNAMDDAKGKLEEGLGKATGNESMEAEGKGDQAGAAVGKAAEKAKEAGQDLKDAAAHTFGH